MEKDMSYLYQTMTTKHLREMRSKKYVRLQKLVNDYSWFANREKESLRSTMKQIDSELAYRDCRVELL